MSTPAKILLAVALAYLALAISSLVGGFIVGMAGAAFHMTQETIQMLIWLLPKLIFTGIVVLGYLIWSKRKKASNTIPSK